LVEEDALTRRGKTPAVIYAPGALGTGLGKTANDLVIYSGGERFRIVAVIDPEHAGKDAGHVVGVGRRGIPVVGSLEEALHGDPEAFIIGAATVGGYIPDGWKKDIIRSLELGMTVYNGLHHFLSEDPEAVEAARRGGGRIVDIRKPDRSRLRIWSGEVLSTPGPRILVAGTDCETGKNIASMEIYLELKRRGVRACLIGTGQTMLLLGARGMVVDAVPSDFVAGVVEGYIVEAFREGCEAVVVEGQAAVTHPAYGHVSLGILRGASPTHIVLAHAAGRRTRTAFPQRMPLTDPRLEYEVLKLLNPYPGCRLAGMTLDTHMLGREEAEEAVRMAERVYGVPVADPIRHGVSRIVDSILG